MSDSAQRKSEAASGLFSESEPVVHFIIPSVICPTPPWAPDIAHRQEAAGDLFFTDKGVVFVQLAKVKRSGAEDVLGWGGISGMMWVLRRKKALAETRGLSGAGDLRNALEEGVDVIFIPRPTITGIRYTWSFGFQVKTRGKWSRSQQFLLEHKRKTYQQYQSQIEDYLAV